MRLLVSYVALIVCQLLPLSVSAQAQTFPNRPVRIITGYTPGGATDVVGRLVAEKLTASLGQPVVLENRPGASGNIAAQAVSRAAPDGHTILLGATAEMAINRHTMKDTGFDPEKDFAPVAFGFLVPLGLLVPSESPNKSLKDFIDSARKSPGKLTFANSGNGTPGHLAGVMLTNKERLDVVQVPYKGGGPAMTDLLGGRVDAYFLSLPGALPHVNAGKVRLLAVSSAKRSRAAPDTPSIAEAGIPEFDFSLWGGFFVPAGTPPEVVTRLNREIINALKQPDLAARLASDGLEVEYSSPPELGRFVSQESGKYGEILKQVGYKPQ